MPGIEVERLGGIEGAPWTETVVTIDHETRRRRYRLGVRSADDREIELMKAIAAALEDFTGRITLPRIAPETIPAVRERLQWVHVNVQALNSEPIHGVFGPSGAGALVPDLTGPVPAFFMDPINWPGEFGGINRLWNNDPFAISDAEVLVRRDELQRQIDLALRALRADLSRRSGWLRDRLRELAMDAEPVIVVAPDRPEVAVWMSGSKSRQFSVKKGTAERLRELASGERVLMATSTASRMRREVEELTTDVLMSARRDAEGTDKGQCWYRVPTRPSGAGAWVMVGDPDEQPEPPCNPDAP